MLPHEMLQNQTQVERSLLSRTMGWLGLSLALTAGGVYAYYAGVAPRRSRPWGRSCSSWLRSSRPPPRRAPPLKPLPRRSRQVARLSEKRALARWQAPPPNPPGPSLVASRQRVGNGENDGGDGNEQGDESVHEQAP